MSKRQFQRSPWHGPRMNSITQPRIFLRRFTNLNRGLRDPNGSRTPSFCCFFGRWVKSNETTFLNWVTKISWYTSEDLRLTNSISFVKFKVLTEHVSLLWMSPCPGLMKMQEIELISREISARRSTSCQVYTVPLAFSNRNKKTNNLMETTFSNKKVI